MLAIKSKKKVVPKNRNAADRTDTSSIIVNKDEAAIFFGVSTEAVSRWIVRGCPVIKRGGKGVEWLFNLSELARWYVKGRDGVEDDPDKMSPDKRLKHYQAEKEKDELFRSRKSLIPAEEVRIAMADLVTTTVSVFDTLVDVLERDADLNGHALTRAQQVADSLRLDLYHRFHPEQDDVRICKPDTP